MAAPAPSENPIPSLREKMLADVDTFLSSPYDQYYYTHIHPSPLRSEVEADLAEIIRAIKTDHDDIKIDVWYKTDTEFRHFVACLDAFVDMGHYKIEFLYKKQKKT